MAIGYTTVLAWRRACMQGPPTWGIMTAGLAVRSGCRSNADFDGRLS